jgi:glutathione S-transferase
LKLFWTPASPFVRKVMVTAIELGVRDRLEIVPTTWPHDWATKTVAFDPQFIGSNPVGRIPTLVTDEGLALPESHLICEYLGQLVREPVLVPSQGPRRWRVLRLQAIVDGLLDGTIARRAETLRKGADRSDDFIDKQRARAARCFDAIEASMEDLNGTLHLGQICVGVACGYIDFRFPDDDWRRGRPKLSTWFAEFEKRPSMMATRHGETPQR